VLANQESIRNSASKKDLKLTLISDSPTIAKVPLTNIISYVPPVTYQLYSYDDATEHLQKGG
jgi:hypothetical protein